MKLGKKRLALGVGSRRGLLIAACVLSTIGAMPAWAQSKGSQPEKKKETLKKEGEKLFSPGRGEQKAGEATGESAWSIMIEGFRGDGQEEAARIALEKVRTKGGLPEAFLEKRGLATVVVYGRFEQGDSKEAKAALAKVRGTELVVSGGKTRPFADAFLAPPANIPGSMPDYDLRHAKQLHGDWVIYTLQIGVYKVPDRQPDAKERAEFKKAAELAVTTLRREGDQAFYYHGPNGSMVTVGLFGKEEFDPQVPGMESPILTSLRKRYPNNLLNGQGIKEKVKVQLQNGKTAEKERMQASCLVAVPKDDSAR